MTEKEMDKEEIDLLVQLEALLQQFYTENLKDLGRVSAPDRVIQAANKIIQEEESVLNNIRYDGSGKRVKEE